MVSKPLRPGTAPGFEAILADLFRVRPSIGRVEAARLIRAKIDLDGLRCERLDVSDVPVQRGLLIDMAGTRVPFPEGEPYRSCYVALVDPSVDALWGHPALWAFIPESGDGDVVFQPTQFPEHALGAVRLRPEPRS